MTLEETLVEVWRQAFAENPKAVVLGTERYRIIRTSKRKLRQVNFVFEGKEIRGLKQNPDTKSRWAAIARDGKKVMQFMSEGRYLANVVNVLNLSLRENRFFAPARRFILFCPFIPFQLKTGQQM